MSLLLEALKKAEKAKEDAQRRAQEGGGAAELRLEGEPPRGGAEDARHVVTRDELPDISTPLEIVSDDLGAAAGAAAKAPPPQAAPEPAPRPAVREAAPSTAGGRAAAKKVFEAKFKEPNPRLPFYITVGVLGGFALGTAGYFWYQLRPPASFVVTNPRPSGGEAPVAAAPAPAAGTPAPVAAAQSAIPGLPTPAQGAPAPAPAPAAPAAQPPAAAPEPAPRPVVAAARPAPRPAQTDAPRSAVERRDVSVNPPAPPQINPRVSTAYSAYLAGDLNAARSEYEQALREEPANRDALLGLAAIEVRSGKLETAEGIYLRLLQADPRDPVAQAALIALRGPRLDPVAAESRLKNLLAAEPEAQELYFTLGNQFAQQGRWAEAQQQFFKAFSAQPENADFAYNLAVSLDHLGQPKPALDYYRRALALGAKGGASFDMETVRTRVAQLAR